MKAQERFNIRSAALVEVQRPNIAKSFPEGICVEFGTKSARSLRMIMAPEEALDLAERLIRAVRERNLAQVCVSTNEALSETGRLLLQSKKEYLQAMLASTSERITKRLMQAELDQTERELALGCYLQRNDQGEL